MPETIQMPKRDFSKLFNPQSIAVIGASSDPQKVGYALMKNLLEGSVPVYPISLSEENILGEKAYASVDSVAGDIDLAIIAIRADSVSGVLEQCGKKGIPFAVIISAGFKEVGGQGAELEEQVLKIAQKHGISVVGPNCLGVLNVQAGLNASFARGMPPAGKTSFITQSGAAAAAFFDWSVESQVGFSKVISFGNRMMLGENDFLDYLANDDETSAIFLYLESMQNGRVFYDLLRKITPRKPVVVIRGGRGERGARATMSHTGSLAPSDVVCSSALLQAGAIEVSSLKEMFNLGKMISSGNTQPLQRIAIVTNGGGPSIVAADLVESSPYLELVELGDETKKKLQEVLPPMAAVNNPVDIIGDAGPDRYQKAINILMEESEIDVVMAMLTPQMMTDELGTARVLAEFKGKKPILAVFIGSASMHESEALLSQSNIPSFNFPEDAIKVLELMARGKKKTTKEKESYVGVVDTEAISFEQSRKLLAEYGLFPEGVLIKDKNGLKEAMTKMEAPVALKLISKDIMHKTEIKALRLNIGNTEDAEQAWSDMEQAVYGKNPNADIEGFLLQEMADGAEVIVGAKRDSDFGAVIVFGVGGVLVNLLEDTSMRIAPVSEAEAVEMIKEIKGAKILEGYRGSGASDIKTLAKIIAGVSRLIYEREEIAEIDLNPVMVSPDGARILDVLVLKNKQ